MGIEEAAANFMIIVVVIPFIATGLARVVDFNKNKALYRTKK